MAWPPPPNKKKWPEHQPGFDEAGSELKEPPSASTAMCFLSPLNFHKFVIYLEEYVADKQKKGIWKSSCQMVTFWKVPHLEVISGKFLD